MPLKVITVAAIIAAGIATWATNGVDLVESAKAAVAPHATCKKSIVSGAGQLRGFAGTEKRTRAAAVADWEQHARAIGAEFGFWHASQGQTLTCQRSILTVRCIARSTPCTA